MLRAQVSPPDAVDPLLLPSLVPIFEWKLIGGESLDLDFPNVTSTGAARLSLAVLPGVLSAGHAYTFRLEAKYDGFPSAFGAITVVMNRPPRGGSFAIYSTPPVEAMSSNIVLNATGWIDDASDLPLQYVFAFRGRDGLSDEIAIGAMAAQSVYSWRAPPGNLSVFCYVIDALDAQTSSAPVDLMVLPALELNQSLAQGIIEEIGSDVVRGDVADGASLAVAFARTLRNIERLRDLADAAGQQGSADERASQCAISDRT